MFSITLEEKIVVKCFADAARSGTMSRCLNVTLCAHFADCSSSNGQMVAALSANSAELWLFLLLLFNQVQIHESLQVSRYQPLFVDLFSSSKVAMGLLAASQIKYLLSCLFIRWSYFCCIVVVPNLFTNSHLDCLLCSFIFMMPFVLQCSLRLSQNNCSYIQMKLHGRGNDLLSSI